MLFCTWSRNNKILQEKVFAPLEELSHFHQNAGKTSYSWILFSLHCLRNPKFTKQRKRFLKNMSVLVVTTYRTWVFLFTLNIHIMFYFFDAKGFLYFWTAFRKNGDFMPAAILAFICFIPNLFQSNKIRFGRRWLAIK